jgi:hypothetical protein
MREWRLSGSVRNLGTEPRRSSRAWRCAGPTQGEEAENQGEREGGNDDCDHRQSAIVRQPATRAARKRRRQCARVNAEPGRDCRKLAQTIADGADRHRREQPPRRRLDETQNASITPEASDSVRPTVRIMVRREFPIRKS